VKLPNGKWRYYNDGMQKFRGLGMVYDEPSADDLMNAYYLSYKSVGCDAVSLSRYAASDLERQRQFVEGNLGLNSTNTPLQSNCAV
jgi:hypothetical protein